MNCADFETRLNDDFDATSAGLAPELLEHKAQCAACREVWERLHLLAEGIGAWRQAIPDVDLASAVVFALKQSTLAPAVPVGIETPRPAHSRRRPGRRALSWAIAGAAACVVAALLAVLRPGVPPATPVAIRPTPVGKAVADADTANHSISDDKHDPAPQMARLDSSRSNTDQQPYYDLAQRAAGALGQMSMLVLPSVPVESQASSSNGDLSAERSTGWIDEFERELKPVGRSLGNAFDFLWQAGESAGG